LKRYADRNDVIVLALPRGGVPVAYEVARQLHVPLDVMVVRKLGVPGNEELAMGALASGGIRVMNDSVVSAAGVSLDAIKQTVAAQLKELQRRKQAYRGHAGTPDIADRIVILVDDGIATGATIRAAVLALRQKAPKQIIIAVPTSSTGARAMLEPMVDDFIALISPADFRAVGQWYDDFTQTTDAEVTRLLAKAADTIPV